MFSLLRADVQGEGLRFLYATRHALVITVKGHRLYEGVTTDALSCVDRAKGQYWIACRAFVAEISRSSCQQRNQSQTHSYKHVQ